MSKSLYHIKRKKSNELRCLVAIHQTAMTVYFLIEDGCQYYHEVDRISLDTIYTFTLANKLWAHPISQVLPIMLVAVAYS